MQLTVAAYKLGTDFRRAWIPFCVVVQKNILVAYSTVISILKFVTVFCYENLLMSPESRMYVSIQHFVFFINWDQIIQVTGRRACPRRPWCGFPFKYYIPCSKHEDLVRPHDIHTPSNASVHMVSVLGRINEYLTQFSDPFLYVTSASTDKLSLCFN
jgi:hypothetical protein